MVATMTSDPRTSLVCHKQSESLLLWPSTQQLARANHVHFSLYPPRKGRDVIDDADWHGAEVTRSGQQYQPVRFRCEKSVTCYRYEPAQAEKRFKSQLQLEIPPRSLAEQLGIEQGAGEEEQKQQRFKRGIEVTQRYKS